MFWLVTVPFLHVVSKRVFGTLHSFKSVSFTPYSVLYELSVLFEVFNKSDFERRDGHASAIQNDDSLQGLRRYYLGCFGVFYEFVQFTSLILNDAYPWSDVLAEIGLVTEKASLEMGGITELATYITVAVVFIMVPLGVNPLGLLSTNLQIGAVWDVYLFEKVEKECRKTDDQSFGVRLYKSALSQQRQQKKADLAFKKQNSKGNMLKRSATAAVERSMDENASLPQPTPKFDRM